MFTKAALLTLCLLALASPALAQAYAPVGYWGTADNGERLLVGADAQCSFEAAGAAPFGGNCTWQSTSPGGILAIWYSTIGGPAAVRWSVVWLNQNAITVNGDEFHRLQ